MRDIHPCFGVNCRLRAIQVIFALSLFGACPNDALAADAQEALIRFVANCRERIGASCASVTITVGHRVLGHALTKRPDEFKQVVDFWNRREPRPSRETAVKGLFELVENLKAGNCRFNTNVVEALIPLDS